ncbi:MAG: glutaredoxin domain-containing protein [Patescibacteria group bacterium]|nr:glutaredoxin domain-containing protein [Patescibacteria group bacterium]
MKKLLLLGLIILPLIILSGCSEKAETKVSGDIILFVSRTCGHCAKVKEYIKQNNINNLVNYREVEAYDSDENYSLFNQKADECDLSQRGVPMVYAGGECQIGSPNVINFFENQAQ